MFSNCWAAACVCAAPRLASYACWHMLRHVCFVCLLLCRTLPPPLQTAHLSLPTIITYKSHPAITCKMKQTSPCACLYMWMSKQRPSSSVLPQISHQAQCHCIQASEILWSSLSLIRRVINYYKIWSLPKLESCCTYLIIWFFSINASWWHHSCAIIYNSHLLPNSKNIC